MILNFIGDIMNKKAIFYLVICLILIGLVIPSNFAFGSNEITMGGSRAGQPPKINTTNVLTAYTNQYYGVQYSATDPDTNQTSLIWRWFTNSTWLTFSSSQLLSGTPTKTGVCWVNISVTDGTSTDVTVFYITVKKGSAPSNQPPKINTSNVLSAFVGIYYSVNYTATDPDTPQGNLTWGWTTNSTWLNFSATQELKGTPTKIGVCWINISVTDGTSYDYAVFYITVYNRPSPPPTYPPVINTTNVLTAYIGKYYSVNYTATDQDTPQGNLTWSWTTNSTWLSFSTTQELKGIPSRIGVCWVNISVSDGTYTTYTVFYITVKNSSTPPPTNKPPVITTTPVRTAYVGKFYSVNFTATDPDTPQKNLTWAWRSNSTWLTFSTNQQLSGTPKSTGVFWVNISVTDGTNIVYSVFYITVKKSSSPPPTTKPPKISTNPVRTAYVGKLYSVNYTATDPDTPQRNLTWGWRTNSTWLTFSTNQQLSGTPKTTGVCWVNISVTDGTHFAYSVFYITIKPAPSKPSNKPPKITTTNVLTAYVGKLYLVNYTATDPDTPQRNLTWTWKTNSSWLNFSTTQQLKGTPTKVGVCWVKIYVSDGNSTDHTTFYISVNRRSTSYSPMIIYSYPASQEKNVTPETTEIIIRFSKSMNIESVSSSLSVSPETAYTMSWNDDATILTITIIEKLSGDTDYSVSIGSSAVDNDGINLQSDYALDFTTALDSEGDDKTGDKNTDNNDKSDTMVYSTIGIIVAILTIMFILLFLIVLRKRRKAETGSGSYDGRVEMAQPIGSVNPAQSVELGSQDDIDNVFENARIEALGPTKPSESGPSRENMIAEFKNKLNNGEISESTYYDVMELLSNGKE
jgi:hypothetical protein